MLTDEDVYTIALLQSYMLTDEDVEVELVEEEPPFLKGHGGKMALDLSPVKIVKVGLLVILVKTSQNVHS